MKYNYDSYALYEYSKNMTFTVRVKITLTEAPDAELLKKAAVKAFVRFPYFNLKVRTDETGGYLLEHNDKPITVSPEPKRRIILGSAETNGHLFSITYENRDLYFNFSHSICGACGALFWIKSTLWQYFTDKTGEQINAADIKIPGTSPEESENAIPDPNDLPSDEPVGMYNGGNSYMPLGDYLKYYLNPFARDAVYFPMEFDLQSVLKYAKGNDGSPNSIISAIMFKALSRVWASNKKVTQISAGIADNYKDDIGCPGSHRDFIRLLHAKYKPEMKDWPVEKLSTATRGSMYLQMQPEISCYAFRKKIEHLNTIDSLDGLKAKCKYASANSPLRKGVKDSFNISYVGKIDWGGLEKYIESVFTITDGHLMFEMNAINDKLFVNFQQVNRKKEYLNAFLEVLKEENISVKLGEMREKHMPLIDLR